GAFQPLPGRGLQGPCQGAFPPRCQRLAGHGPERSGCTMHWRSGELMQIARRLGSSHHRSSQPMTDPAVSGGASPARILLIDDEAGILKTFRFCLEDAGYRVSTAQNSQQALAAVEREVFDVCFLDLRLGDESGIELLPKLQAAAPWMRVVIATAHSAVDTAVDAMQAGAADYLVKPCTPEQLLLAADKQAEARRLELRIEALESAVSRDEEPEFVSA